MGRGGGEVASDKVLAKGGMGLYNKIFYLN